MLPPVRLCLACFVALLFTIALFGATFENADNPYGFNDWPGRDGVIHDGIDIATVELDNLTSGRVYFRQPSGGTKYTLKRGKTHVAAITIMVSDTPLDAHNKLRDFLVSSTRSIPRTENSSMSFGDVSFVAMRENNGSIEKVSLIAFTRANITVVLQNFSNRMSAAEIKALAEKVDAAIQARPVVESAKQGKPVIKDVPVDNDGVIVVEVTDPHGLALFISHRAPSGVDCERKGNILTFSAENPGTYTLRVTATNKLNLSTTEEFTLVK